MANPTDALVMKRGLLLPILCGLVWLCPGTARAQTPSPARKLRTAPVSKTSPWPLILGVGIGSLILGGALGWALKKPQTSAGEAALSAEWWDYVPFPLATIDETERFSRRNPACEKFFGPENDQLPHLVHPGDLTRARAQLHEVLSGSRAEISLPCRFFGAGGAPVHAVMNARRTPLGRRGDAVLLAFRDTSAQASAERELHGAREAISALYEVVAGDKSRDLDGKIRSLLAMGCGRFELPVGVLGRFAGEDFETLWVQSADRRVRPALTFARPKAPDAAAETALLGLGTLPRRSNYERFPFLARNDRSAYLGAPVVVEGELFGMLSFASLSAREDPFTPGEIELLQLMADWVGGEIERENNKVALQKQRKALLEANEKLEKLATHDPLTGAKNRRAFNEKLDEEWSRARRYGTPLSLVMLDVDKFKLFNDSFGHPAGDAVLQRVASVLMAGIRATDFVARYGGEEFVLILTNTDADGAMILANRLRQNIENSPWKERQVTASLGIATLAPEHKVGAELLSAADGALYESKERGRNRVTHTRDFAVPAAELDETRA